MDRKIKENWCVRVKNPRGEQRTKAEFMLKCSFMDERKTKRNEE